VYAHDELVDVELASVPWSARDNLVDEGPLAQRHPQQFVSGLALENDSQRGGGGRSLRGQWRRRSLGMAEDDHDDELVMN
jgi:hypothetical protein